MLKRIKRCAAVLALVAVAAPAFAISAEELLKDLNEGTAERKLSAAMKLADFAQFPEVASALAARLQDPAQDTVLRSRCASSLGRAQDPAVYPLVSTLAKTSTEKPIVRSACIVSMVQLKGEDAIPELIEMLRTEKSNAVRAQIESVLSNAPRPEIVAAAVTPLLKDPDAEASAIRVLGATGGPGVIAPLTRQLTEGKASTRRAVISALASTRRPEAAKALVEFYPKASDAEKVDILAVLSGFPEPGVVDLMIRELSTPKTFAPLRVRAALSLGILRAKDGIMPLRVVLLDLTEPDGLRLTCATALGNFSNRDDDAVLGLIGALADKKIAQSASLALSRITNQYFGVDQAKWKTWFDNWVATRDQPKAIGH
jgi:HEAT repeat protein